MADEKNPKEASNIFHSIMKASVTPNKLTDEDIIEAVKQKQDNRFILVDSDLTPKHKLVKEIDQYINHIRKHGI